GGTVHCIVNGWENQRIVELAESIRASWSTGLYWYPLAKPKPPAETPRMLCDIARTSSGLRRVAARVRPADGLAPHHLTVLPTAPEGLVAYTAQLRARVNAAGAGERVHFAGVRENMLETMKASYLLAAPILQEETCGNVALEARSVGLPVVTFERGGLPELVE